MQSKIRVTHVLSREMFCFEIVFYRLNMPQSLLICQTCLLPCFANGPKKLEAAAEPATVPAAREQMRSWLQCDKCACWRLVERTAVPAVDPAVYSQGPPGADDP